ncbi:unnamed protein product, partial [Tetraodon nigroviridis]
NIEGEVSWQPQPGIRTDSATLPVDPSIDWDLQPVCMATFTGIGMCQKALQFTLYKTPDSVSLRHVDDLSAVVENQQFRLRCDVTGVAPAQNVTVLWYQGNKTVQSVKKSWQEDYLPLIAGLVAITVIIISVVFVFVYSIYYKNTKMRHYSLKNPKLNPQNVPPTFPDATEEELQLQDTSPLLLNCTASGNPAPAYSWDLADPIQLAYVNSTTSQLALKPLLQLPGIYRCTAKNSQGTTTKAFTVIEPESETFAFIFSSFCNSFLLFSAGSITTALFLVIWRVLFIRNSREQLIRPQGLNR